MIGAAVFDFDGTICFDGRTIGADILHALRELRSRTRLVFASARPIRDLLPVPPADLHVCALIGGNGAFTRDAGILSVQGISPELRTALDELIDRHGLPYLIDGEWDYAFTGEESHVIFRQLDAGRLARNVDRGALAAYSKVILFTSDADVIGEFRELGLPVSEHPNEGTIDITPTGVTKLDGLVRLGVPDGSYVAFGNDANDVLMLQRAAVSYRVGDHPMLGFANHSCDPTGVAAAIAELAR